MESSEAAEAFTEAIDLIEAGEGGGAEDLSVGLTRQLITLINNRSAMYEKSGENTLALADCDAILDRQPAHQKARNRRLRILEAMGRPVGETLVSFVVYNSIDFFPIYMYLTLLSSSLLCYFNLIYLKTHLSKYAPSNCNSCRRIAIRFGWVCR